MREIDYYEEALEEAQEKIDYLDDAITKVEVQIKNFG